MKPLVAQTLRSRWLAGFVHAGSWLLLYLVLAGIGGKAPLFHEADGSVASTQIPIPITKLEQLFTSRARPNLAVPTNALNPFFTRHFIPPPTPAPPPPTTRKIELTYQGFYQTEGGVKQTMVKMADAFLVTPVGAKVTANLFAADASLQTLVLTNATATQTNLLPLNTKKELEVPIK